MPKELARRYYLLAALMYGGVNANAAMYTVFLEKNGMTVAEIYQIKAVYFVTVFFCALFAGALADWFGRKALAMTACVLFMVSMLGYTISGSFWQFVAAEVIFAGAQACANSAITPWFVDSAREKDYGGPLHRYISTSWFFSNFTALITGWVGGFLAKQSMNWTWLFAAAIFVLGFFIAWRMMREEYRWEYRKPKELKLSVTWKDFWVRMGKSLRFGFGNMRIVFIMVVVFFVYFAFQAPNLMWQIHFRDWAPDAGDRTRIVVQICVFLMFGAFSAPYLIRYVVCERKSLLICAGLIAGGVICSGFEGFSDVLIAFLLCHLGRGGFSVIKDANMQHVIDEAHPPEELRATIGALETMAYHAGSAVGHITWGILLPGVSVQTAWVSSGSILAVVVICLVPFAFSLQNGNGNGK